MKNKFSKYETVTKAFQKFFNEEEISIMMDRKVDKNMLAQMSDTKASKEELKQTNSLIDSLNERMKHLSVVHTQLAGTFDPVRESMQNFDAHTQKQLQQKLYNI